jgi:hypothetical protein
VKEYRSRDNSGARAEKVGRKDSFLLSLRIYNRACYMQPDKLEMGDEWFTLNKFKHFLIHTNVFARKSYAKDLALINHRVAS